MTKSSPKSHTETVIFPFGAVAGALATPSRYSNVSRRCSTICRLESTEPDLNKVYGDILASGRQPLIIDCGANIGASVMWFSARYPQAHIIGIEPAPDNFELLRLNCAHLDVDLRQAGISADDGHAYLWEGKGDMGYQVSDVDDLHRDIGCFQASLAVHAIPSQDRYRRRRKVPVSRGLLHNQSLLAHHSGTP